MICGWAGGAARPGHAIRACSRTKRSTRGTSPGRARRTRTRSSFSVPCTWQTVLVKFAEIIRRFSLHIRIQVASRSADTTSSPLVGIQDWKEWRSIQHSRKQKPIRRHQNKCYSVIRLVPWFFFAPSCIIGNLGSRLSGWFGSETYLTVSWLNC